MAGMSNQTGHEIDGIDAIRQSVRDILATRIGTRVMRRDYGSMLPDLVDQPLNDATLLRTYSATITALLVWEPRIRVRRITKHVDASNPAAARLQLSAITNTGEPADIDVPMIGAGQNAA